MRRAAALLVGLLLLALPAHAFWQSRGPGINSSVSVASSSVTLDAAGTEQKSSAGVTTANNTGLTIAAGNALIAVVVISNGASAPTGVSANWDSGGTPQAMTLLASQNVEFNLGTAFIFGLRNPTAGNKTLTVSWTGAAQAITCGISFSGANVTSDATAFPVGGRTTLLTASTTTPSLNVTSASGHMTVGAVADNGGTFSAPTGGTSLFIENSGAASDAAAQYANGAATVTFGWTNSASQKFGMVGADISP